MGKLTGKRVLITSGGTSAAIDPVRVITNRSSGKMGTALQSVATKMGAEVILIKAETVEQLESDIKKEFANIDILIMAAAVSDYKPTETAVQKIKSDKEKITIELIKTKDLLAYFGNKKDKQYLVGFALESENLIENAMKKMEKKNLDLIIANDISALGADVSSITIIDKIGNKQSYKNLSKQELAERIIEKICRDLNS